MVLFYDNDHMVVAGKGLVCGKGPSRWAQDQQSPNKNHRSFFDHDGNILTEKDVRPERLIQAAF